MSTTKKVLIVVGIVLVIAGVCYWYWSNKKADNKKIGSPVAATSPLATNTDTTSNTADSGQSAVSNNAAAGE